jgi:uncharacterized protein (DUF1330 family)
MSAYALAHLREVDPHPEILEYLEKIQATLDPFSGRFIVHGGAIDAREGAWPGNLVIIEFPSTMPARGTTRQRISRSCHSAPGTSRVTRSSSKASSLVMTQQRWPLI